MFDILHRIEFGLFLGHFGGPLLLGRVHGFLLLLFAVSVLFHGVDSIDSESLAGVFLPASCNLRSTYSWHTGQSDTGVIQPVGRPGPTRIFYACCRNTAVGFNRIFENNALLLRWYLTKELEQVLSVLCVGLHA